MPEPRPSSAGPRAAGRRELIPPKIVIEVARSTMGGIDLDPFSNAEVNHVVQAARYLERTDCLEVATGRHWTPSGQKRVLLNAPSGVPLGRALANKLLMEYRAGHIREAVFWAGSNEVLTRCPWIWDFPVCIPFSRLAPQFWDDELEQPIRVAPADWSAIVHLPVPWPTAACHRSLARFHAAAAPHGRVVLDKWSGESRWQDAYAAQGRPYDYTPGPGSAASTAATGGGER